MIRAQRRSRRGTATLGLGLAAVLLAATACGGDEGDAASGEGGQVNLTVSVFGNFGYEQLYREYEASHPGVKITERGTGSDLSNYTPALTKNLATGSGAGDVVALEEGIMIQFKEKAQNFVDLGQYGGNEDKANFLPWKFEGGQSADGQKLIGLGTDVGSMGMCYRRDLFQAAGLPTDREEVAKLWPNWDAYTTVGKQFIGKSKAKWFDAASNTYNTILVQEAGKSPGYTYFDKENKLAVESNPAVKQSYDRMIGMIGDGLSAGYKSFSDQWNAGFKQGTFATIACPAWMLGYIQGQAGEANKGKWDVTKAPGDGGNWGGSWLGVPTQSKHPKEAAELVRFLTSPKSQVEAFKAVNALPSSPVALDDPATKAFKNPYFNDAPVGEIFGSGAKELQPVYFGPRNQAVRDAVENTLLAVQQGKLKPEEAWSRAVRDAEQAAK
jgi:cellobiose transport system substrate-binding protein